MWTHLLFLPLLIAGVGTGASAACTAKDPHDARALKYICDMERAWGQAFVKTDPTVAREMLADDFVGVDTKGRPYRKADEIADISKPAHFASDVLNDVAVRFFGTTAIAQGSDSWTTTTSEAGRFAWTDVWLKRDGKWQVVASEDLIAAKTK